MPFTHSPIDGTQLHYLDYAPSCLAVSGTLVFLHGWPMSSAMFTHLMLPLCESHGVRCVALDRCGFGRSEWNGKTQKQITYQTFADDTVHVLNEAGVGDFVFVGSSMGCGESILAYDGEWVRGRCKGFIWLGASLPFPIQTSGNPLAPSRELWDMILGGLRTNRAAFVKASLPGIFGMQEGGPVTPETGLLEQYERIVQEADSLAMERCIQIITEKDFTKELETLEGDEHVKVLLIHGDQDQGMPFEASGKIVKEILGTKCEVKIYEGAAHGLCVTHAGCVLEDVLGFCKSVFGQEVGSGPVSG